MQAPRRARCTSGSAVHAEAAAAQADRRTVCALSEIRPDQATSALRRAMPVELGGVVRPHGGVHVRIALHFPAATRQVARTLWLVALDALQPRPSTLRSSSMDCAVGPPEVTHDVSHRVAADTRRLGTEVVSCRRESGISAQLVSA